LDDGGVAAGKWRGRGHGQCSSGSLNDTWGPRGFNFSNLFKIGSNWKSKKNALSCSKDFQILHDARLGHYKQLSQLCPHPNINRCRVKIPGTDSQFIFLVNF
jgi:hypothetical protein